MGDGTRGSPYTREDVLRLIKENGGEARGLDLSGKFFELRIDLSKLNLIGIILKGAFLIEAHLEGAYLGDAHLEGADLWLAHFSADTRMEGADWGNYILGEEKHKNYELAAATYRPLKQWHTNAGMYDVAGKFYYNEMEAKRKGLTWRRNLVPKLWQTFYWRLAGYGEVPWQVLLSASFVILSLALIYLAIGTLKPNTFLDCLYFSAVSFTALGYGSWIKEATGWVKGLGVVESFIGVFMMALFIVTFTRKMTR